MVFNLLDASKVILSPFPALHIGTKMQQFAPSFQYLRHIITCNNNDNDDNIQRETNNTFVCTNIPLGNSLNVQLL